MNQGGDHMIREDFVSLYQSLREKEERVFSDSALWQLPEVEATHPHFAEWQLRKTSAKRLILWLIRKKSPLDILEIGCGNGWLSHQLAAIPGSRVTGTDINSFETEQAKRVFASKSNLNFIHGEASPALFKGRKFDIILFASAMQYFESVGETIGNARSMLKSHGEIHIMDSPFYREDQREEARQRSIRYYESLGFSEMSRYYFHHSYDELKGIQFRLLYDPGKMIHRLKGNRNPFPWICIQ